jgi:hypothetical protein
MYKKIGSKAFLSALTFRRYYQREEKRMEKQSNWTLNKKPIQLTINKLCEFAFQLTRSIDDR